MCEQSSYQRLREHLAYLRLTTAAEHLSAELDRALRERLSPTQVLERLLELEVEETRVRRQRYARYPVHMTLEGFDFQRSLDRKLIAELSTLRFDQASADWILQVVSRRYEKRSIVLSSNRGFSDRGHDATVLNIRGHSYRMRALQEDDTGGPAMVR